MKKWASYNNQTRGFTIVELLIVIVVIGILAAVTIVSFNGVSTRARDASRSSAITSVQKALEMYRIDNNDLYPSVGSDNAGYSLSSLATALVPKYLPAIPVDPSASSLYSYVRGASGAAYAIRMNYESKTNCHVGVGARSSGWWGLASCESL